MLLNLIKKYSFRVMRNSFWIGLGDVSHKSSIFLASILITRYYSLADMGRITYMINFTSFFMAFSDMGLSAIGLRDLCRLENKRDYWNKILTIRIVFSPIVILSWFFLVIINKSTPDVGYFAFLSMIYSLSFILRDFFLVRFKADERMHFDFIAKMLGFIILIGGIYLGSLNSVSIIKIFSLYPISTAATMFLTLFLLIKNVGTLKFDWDKDFLKNILKESYPVTISYFLFFLFIKIDVFFVYNILGEEVTGLYQICVNLVTVIVSILLIMITGTFPIMSKSIDSHSIKKKYAIAVSFLLFTAGIAVYGVLIITGNHLIELLYGKGYEKAFAILKWYGLFIAPYFAISFINYYLVAAGNQKKLILMYGLSIILIPLIPVFLYLKGPNGAAFALSVIGDITFLYGVYLIYKIKSPVLFE